jgi:hypothetical protein
MGVLARSLGLALTVHLVLAGCGGTEGAASSEAPPWLDGVDAVAGAAHRVVVEHSMGRAEVVRRGDRWVRVNWADHPVPEGRMAELFALLAGARSLPTPPIEARHHARIGLDGELGPGEVEFEAFDESGTSLLALRIGAPEFDSPMPARFALVRGGAARIVGFPAEIDAIDLDPHPWSARHLLLLGRDRIERFTITDADGNTWGGFRASPQDVEFAAAPPLEPDSLMPIFTTLAGRAPLHLPFDRAAWDADIERSETGRRATYEFETFDGLIVRIETCVDAGREQATDLAEAERWLTLEARTREGASEGAKAEARALDEIARGRAFRVPGREIFLLRSVAVPAPGARRSE